MRAGVQLHDGTGRIGAVAALIDCVGGAIAGPLVAPGWMATADLSLELFRPWSGGWIRAEGTTLRSGRSTVVLQVDLVTESDARMCGRGYLTFAVLPGRNGNPIMHEEQPTGRRSLGDIDGGKLAILECLGATAEGNGAVRSPITAYSRNTLDAMHGGAVALLMDSAAESTLCAVAPAVALRATALSLTYIARNTIGPVFVQAEVASIDECIAATTIEVRDEGAERTTAHGWIRYALNEGARI